MSRIGVLLAAALSCAPFAAQAQPKRPAIIRIAHVRLYVTNADESRFFYTKIVGLESSGLGCAGVALPCFAINEGQSIELEQVPSPAPANWVAEVVFLTDNVARMRRYLLAREIKAGAIVKDGGGAPRFDLADPEGNPIAFVQGPAIVEPPIKSTAHEHRTDRDVPTGDPSRTSGNVSAGPIGTRLFHAGFVVRDAAVEDRFYREILGFRMYWHGGFKDNDVDWEELQVPDGSDWIEYMLNISPTADHKELGIQNHFSLGVTNVKEAYDRLLAHGLKANADDKPEIGRDGKWSFDIYDPDATRVEFMEFQPAQKPCCHPYEAAHPTP